MLALAVVATLPCRAVADAATTYFENLARCMGATVDLTSAVWQDKTKAAYAAYISDNLQRFVPTANGIYACGQQLEELTGFDVVATLDGELYMRNPGGGYNVDNYVKVTSANYSSLCAALLEWFAVAVNDGPAWPNGEGGGTSTGGGTLDTFQNPQILNGVMGKYHPENNSAGWYEVVGTSVNLTISNIDEIKANFQQNNVRYVTVIKIKDNRNYDGYCSVYVIGSQTNISITGEEVGVAQTSPVEVKQYKYTITSETPMIRYANTVTNESLTQTLTLSSRTVVQDSMVFSPRFGMWSTQALASGGGSGGGATDDNPPSGGGDILPITITWPDISYTGPTYNYEGDTYNTTSGDIDWSPVTDRLDEMAEEFELYANSFEDFRSDFLQMWHALGGGLQDLSGQLTAIENRLNRVLDWLINIFNKMPGGAAATQPNPDTDEGGFWDWLGRLLEKLLGNLPETAQDFQSALAQLTGRFPFSVPWDLAAMLGLFAHDPITPNVTFYLPTVTQDGFSYDVQTAVPVTINCADYNDVAALARRLEFITFAILLAKWTIEGIKGIDWTLFG